MPPAGEWGGLRNIEILMETRTIANTCHSLAFRLPKPSYFKRIDFLKYL
jgi:hypothetical protein